MNRILVVDDEESILKAVGRVFLDPGYELRFARSGGEALESVAAFPPDLVILDVMMPQMDGYEVCRRLKSDAKTAGIMVLLLSGMGQLGDRLRGYEVEADDYLTKPYDPDELQAKAEILLRLKSVQDELRSTNRNLEKIVAAKTRELVRKESQALVGQMVQGIVHNLRSPMTVVGGMANLAARRLEELPSKYAGAGKEEWQRITGEILGYLGDIMTAEQRIEAIISNLLVKGRQEATAGRQRINLNDLLTRELEFLEADMEIKHGLQKTLRLDPELPELSGTYADFSQVCYNMVKNASDAMRGSLRKELLITTSHDDCHIYLEFQDTGCGIAPEHLEHVFEPFFTTKPLKGAEEEGEATGTGLGLYTCARLLEPYGARIRVKSEPDAGTLFTIAIPLQQGA